MSKILITGAAGLIGRAVSPILVQRNHEVVGIDIHPSGENVSFGDVRLSKTMQELMHDVDGIVHLAAISRVVAAQNDPSGCYETNVHGLSNVFRAAVESKRKPWVIFSSSREVYGDQDLLPVQEDAQLRPLNVYANSKVVGEKIADTARFCGIKTAVVRFSNVYGSVLDHETRVIPAFVRAAIANRELTVEGRQNTFDFVHVSDAANGLAKLIECIENSEAHIPPIHLVTGRGTTLQELSQMVVDIAGAGDPRPGTPRNFDVSKFVGDPRRAKNLLGWEASVALENGLEMMVADMRSHFEAGGPDRPETERSFRQLAALRQ